MTVHIEPRTLTNDEFYEFVRLPENDLKTFELIDGVVYEMPSPLPIHAYIVLQIAHCLWLFAQPLDVGYVFTDNLDYELAPGMVLRPDASFILKGRLPSLMKRISIAPDIAVEVISPSNTPYDMQHKIEAYFRHGVRLFWGVYPLERVVRVITPNADGTYTTRMLTENDMLTGGDVLPGFSVAVRDLFPPQDLSDESSQPHVE
jgi:Uma2 family endonuclease